MRIVYAVLLSPFFLLAEVVRFCFTPVYVPIVLLMPPKGKARNTIWVPAALLLGALLSFAFMAAQSGMIQATIISKEMFQLLQYNIWLLLFIAGRWIEITKNKVLWAEIIKE